MTQDHLMGNFSRKTNRPHALRLSFKRHPFAFLKILDHDAFEKCTAGMHLFRNRGLCSYRRRRESLSTL